MGAQRQQPCLEPLGIIGPVGLSSCCPASSSVGRKGPSSMLRCIGTPQHVCHKQELALLSSLGQMTRVWTWKGLVRRLFLEANDVTAGFLVPRSQGLLISSIDRKLDPQAQRGGQWLGSLP